MASFRERIGVIERRFEPQLDELDEATRMALWNAMHRLLELVRDDYSKGERKYQEALDRLWCSTFQCPRDKFNAVSARSRLKEEILHGDAYFVLEIVDDLSLLFDDEGETSTRDAIQSALNSFFENYLVGYRFTAGRLNSITAPEEVAEVNAAAGSTALSQSARTHLMKAIGLLSDRENKNYSKTIAESIDAVEAELHAITGKTTMSKALAALPSVIGIKHPAIISAWERLYGWAGDAGVRHANLKDEVHTQELAQYVVITSSAFLNFLAAAKK